MKLNIANQLKKRDQLEIAELQDNIISIAYSVTDDLILHGCTSIWRCYSGKRFSVDIDLYSKNFEENMNEFSERLRSQGLNVIKMKNTGNIIFSSISNDYSTVKFDINHIKDVKGELCHYEMVDGSIMEVLSLSAYNLIIEKIKSYNNRRFIRDLYDIYHLLLIGTEPPEELNKFIDNIKKPVDESVLKTIVYSGIAPSYNRMINEIRRLI